MDELPTNTHPQPRIILIDQSLRSLGGHHHEYAVEVLRAAESAGYKPILAINRDFTQLDSFPRSWQVVPIFPYRSDRIHRVPKAASYRLWQPLFQPGGSLSGKIAGIVEGVADRVKSRVNEYRWGRQRSRIKGFADACRVLFEQIRLQPCDHVYCSTVSDMDLLGLVHYLKSHPESKQATWHLQFHFGVFAGRDPQYAKQYKIVHRLRQRFESATRELSNHNVHFYTTTDELRRQFNWLKTAEFRTLPWPVSTRFHLERRSAVTQSGTVWQSVQDGLPIRPTGLAAPLRLVCAGGVRREKGGELLGPLMNALESEFLKSHKVQLLIQTGKKRKSQAMLGFEPRGVTEIESFSSGHLPKSPVLALPHPLSPDAYADLIRSADIGLLLYDSDEYFARCSGILVELLAAGVPVIGPAGCWLGDQIEQANREYVNSVLGQSVTVSQWSLDQATFSDAADRHNRITNELTLEAPGADLLVRLAVSPSATAGMFARVTLEQFAADGKKTVELATILGATAEPDRDDSLLTTLFPVHADTARIRLTAENAYDAAPSPLRQHDAMLINRADGRSGHQPMGRIGLTISSPEFIPQLLRDLVENYAHYRASTEEFAIEWCRKHSPARTIERLTASTKVTWHVALRPAS